ncbi:hypothetical protein R3P38DRAFT_3238705 [Favolaschia claudopus]|uniref:Uncharacterized protein n=1 Tax=Favolaschia claudopus TaxID=2862362 RepID=A0AAV9Z9P6_9AGAR
MDNPIVNLYYRLYDGHLPLASKHPFQPNHTNLSSIDVNSIPPPYTVAKITQSILEREAEKQAYTSAELYLDRRDAKPAAGDVIVDVEKGDSTKPLTAVRLVVRPESNRGRSAVAGVPPGMPNKTQLAMLWPEPGPPLTADSPGRWPGISPESTAAVRDYLQKDFEQHHGFFNFVGAHNHTPFHLLVEWVLGGATEHLTAIWDQHVALERLRFESPHPITEETFFDHLGDEQYYRAYLYFFCDLVLRKPVHAVVEEWIFGTRVNFGSEKAGMREDGMVNRLLAGFLHPLIYVGFGLEFGWVFTVNSKSTSNECPF